MEPRFVLLIVLLLFVTFGPDPQVLRNRSPREAADFEWWSDHFLGILRNSSYGDFDVSNGRWLNLTGFRREDGYQWEVLDDAKAKIRAQFEEVSSGLDLTVLPVYHRPVGEIRGKFNKVREGGILDLNLTALAPEDDFITASFQRNITEAHGEISVDLAESEWDRSNTSISAQKIEGSVKIYTDSSPSNGWDVKMVGVHLVRSGTIVMSTISDKFNAGFALPQLMLSKEDYTYAKPVVDEMMTEALRKIRDGEQPARTASLFAAPNCEFIVWMHQKPIRFDGVPQNRTVEALERIENEMETPEGVPVGLPPNLDFPAILFSPDCGFVLEADLTGPKSEVYWSLAARLLSALIVVIALQIALLKRQMEEASTPSRKSRISYQSIGIMAIGDFLIFSGVIALAVSDDSLWLLVAAASFVSCVHVAFLEVKFLFDLWTVQVGQPAERERERAPTTVVTTDGGLPLPVTARRPVDTGATPIILPPDQDIEAAAAEDERAVTVRVVPAVSFAALYSRFYFFMMILMFLSMWALTWPRPLRSAYANTCAFLYLSFWTPQIYRNVVRNCRKALSWEYVFGVTVLRASTVIYWYLADRNLLAIDANATTGYVMLGWVGTQVLVLVGQQFLGPRTFVKEEWCPPAYDYHPILREDEEEAGLPIGYVASASEAKNKDSKEENRKIFDCAICMNEIDVPVVSRGEGKGSTWLEQRNYMVTPCRHIFHSECLEGWMNLRLVCPICREALPPL